MERDLMKLIIAPGRRTDRLGGTGIPDIDTLQEMHARSSTPSGIGFWTRWNRMSLKQWNADICEHRGLCFGRWARIGAMVKERKSISLSRLRQGT